MSKSHGRKYTDDEIRKYLNMYMERIPVSNICRGKDAPSRPTFYRWIREGQLTNGEPWDQYRDRMDRETAIQVREREMLERKEGDEAFMEIVQHDIRNLYEYVRESILNGMADVQVSDIERLVRLYANVDSRQVELQEWKEQFAAWMFSTAMEIMDERQYDLFRIKVQEKMIADNSDKREKGSLLLGK